MLERSSRGLKSPVSIAESIFVLTPMGLPFLICKIRRHGCPFISFHEPTSDNDSRAEQKCSRDKGFTR